jgi:hypothetical protein
LDIWERERALEVTCRSSITSSNAACVLGLPRLISSAMSTLVKAGPSRNEKLLDRWSKTITPVMSVGSRSGVNWTRFQEPEIEFAMALAKLVFPVPGTSSRSRWPSVNRQQSASRTSWRLPRTTLSTLSISASTTVFTREIIWLATCKV